MIKIITTVSRISIISEISYSAQAGSLEIKGGAE